MFSQVLDVDIVAGAQTSSKLDILLILFRRLRALWRCARGDGVGRACSWKVPSQQKAGSENGTMNGRYCKQTVRRPFRSEEVLKHHMVPARGFIRGCDEDFMFQFGEQP